MKGSALVFVWSMKEIWWLIANEGSYWALNVRRSLGPHSILECNHAFLFNPIAPSLSLEPFFVMEEVATATLQELEQGQGPSSLSLTFDPTKKTHHLIPTNTISFSDLLLQPIMSTFTSKPIFINLLTNKFKNTVTLKQNS